MWAGADDHRYLGWLQWGGLSWGEGARRGYVQITEALWVEGSLRQRLSPRPSMHTQGPWALGQVPASSPPTGRLLPPTPPGEQAGARPPVWGVRQAHGA